MYAEMGHYTSGYACPGTDEVCFSGRSHFSPHASPQRPGEHHRVKSVPPGRAACIEKCRSKGFGALPNKHFATQKSPLYIRRHCLHRLCVLSDCFFYKIHSPCTNKSDVQGLLAYRGYLNSFLSCSGLLKYSARYCERIFSVAMVLLMPVSSQNCSSWSLIVVASFMFRIFASFFCLGILVYSLKVVSLSPLNIFFKVLMEFDVRLEYWHIVIGF